ncbi:MAG TPA: hypothetical protein VMX75_07370 [Spirochaetia bacterium]|nr:hypothetical protein [Spirochaetia bacterium]
MSLQSIRDTLSRVESLEYRGLMKKVWNRIRKYRQKAAVSPVPIFKRSLSVPLPIAALAAVLIVLLGFSAVYYLARGDFHMLKLTTEPSGIMEMRLASPIEDLEVILKSLESHEFKKETVIQLPTNSQFFILGEPVLIRADELKGSYAR